MSPQTLAEKVWERHVVHRADGEPDLLYVDLHLVHEVTAPQAFDGLRAARSHRPSARPHRRDHGPQRADHARARHRRDQRAGRWTRSPRTRRTFGVTLYPMGSPGQGIVHVIGPEQGYTQPGLVIVCGDSHTSTHGAFGALAFGIGTSRGRARPGHADAAAEPSPSTMAVTVEGELPAGVAAKDVILGIINRIGTNGGVGHVIEYRGSAIRALSMEGRMTICNMSIEAGARAGMVAPDDTTFAYVEGGPHAPQGADWERALDDWRTLPTDDGATFDTRGHDRRHRAPSVRHAGARTRASASRSTARCPTPKLRRGRQARGGRARARVHGARARHADPRDPTRHDLHRLVHELAHGGPARRRRASSAAARSPPACARWSCPARSPSSRRPKREGLDRGLRAMPGFEWRGAGCSMCLGMNPDIAEPRRPERQHQQPQLRGTPGQGRPHAPGEPRRRRRHRDRRPLQARRRSWT